MRKLRIPVLALATSVALSGISVAHANAQLPPAPPAPAVEFTVPAPEAGVPEVNPTAGTGSAIMDLSSEIYKRLPGNKNLPPEAQAADTLLFATSNGVVGLAALVLAGLVFLVKSLLKL
ncbi:hypothetical protein CMUST_03680 [Corynebacterium mustelae]|uniref:Uncharacterized protein n=1 Tax=Corynebacterium mustelae TaxID=571915 RepID=A0A0G3GWZ9_9CORY|nr:hypothetical protein [Corynebacterium mustelae]AKK05080.1 hypothetical protein CMUST_03680 [Corynebacterium mustelae]